MSSNVKEHADATESSENEQESKRTPSNEKDNRQVTVGNNYVLSKRRTLTPQPKRSARERSAR